MMKLLQNRATSRFAVDGMRDVRSCAKKCLRGNIIDVLCFD